MNRLLRINNNIFPLDGISYLSYNYNIKLIDDSVLSVIQTDDSRSKKYSIGIFILLHMKNGETIKHMIDKFILNFDSFSEADEYAFKVSENALKEYINYIFGNLKIEKLNVELKK